MSVQSPSNNGTIAPVAQLLPATVVAGFMMLLASAFLDNSRGPILPQIAHDLLLDWESASWFLVAGQLFAIPAMLLLTPLLRRVGVHRTAFWICVLGIGAAVSAFAVDSFPTLLAFATLYGVAVSVFGTTCNILVITGTPERLRGRFLAGLHVMYGLGSALAPAACAAFFERGWPWVWLPLIPIPLLVATAALSWIVRQPSAVPRNETPPRSSRPGRREYFVIALFAIYVLGEVLTSLWLTSYLVEARHLELAVGAVHLTGFFVVLATSRVLAAAFSTPQRERAILVSCLVAALTAFIIGLIGPSWALCGVGLVGPFFPLLLARVSRSFPATWQTTTVWLMVAVNVTLGLTNLAIGRIADALGLATAFALPPVFLVLTIVMLVGFFRLESPVRRES